MSGLVEFLRARLDEEEAIAKSATPGPWTAEVEIYQATKALVQIGLLSENAGPWSGTFEVIPVAEAEGNGDGGVLTAGDAKHIARHDPARVLAEVEAKRNLITEFERVNARAKYPDSEGGMADGLELAVSFLALPYADHPDYREEWKP